MWNSNSNQAEDGNSCKIFTRLFIENIMSTTARNSNFRVDKLRQRNTGYQRRMRKTLKCSKCRNHGRLAVLKGHKKNCPYRECACSKCILVCKRQRFLAAQMGLERSSESRDTDNPAPLNVFSSENAASFEHSQNVSKGYRHQDSQTVCSSMPSICSTFKLPDPNQSTVVSAPPQLITTHKSTNSNDQNFLYHKTVVTTQITTRTDMTCSVANSFTFAASNQIFRPSYPSNTNMQHGTWPLSHKGPSTNTNMQHGTWPLSHKGPLPDSSHATTFNPLVFPNHFADSRNSLKIRYLNLLARLFPQFSDIFINSVLEEARGELLAAAEWLVQLEDRRSFMYPTFDPFTPIPMLSPHFGNPNYTHNKTSYSHQASESSSKYLPSSTLHNSNNRFDKDCIPQPADLQSNIPKFFVTPQMMSAPGPPNMSCLLLPNENMHNKSSSTDARPYSRLSLVQDSSQLERSAPKSFSENRLVPQQNYFIQSHQACTPQYSTSAKPTEMEHASMVYSNDNSTGYASDKLTPDPNHAIACSANMVISNAKMIANSANMVPGDVNVITNNASMRAVSVREIPHADGGQEFNCTTQDHQATDEQQSKLHCFALLSARQGKEEDVEQKLSVISEYIIENDDGEDGSQLHTKANTTDYRENDMDSDVSSRDSNDSNL